MASITSSLNAPFNSLLIQDANYTVTASFGNTSTTASSTACDFKVASPFPATSEVIAWVGATNGAAGTGSVAIVLQESADSVTWTACANIANPLFNSTGSVATASAQVGLQPGALRYLRVSAITPGSVLNSTGSVTLAILM